MHQSFKLIADFREIPIRNVTVRRLCRSTGKKRQIQKLTIFISRRVKRRKNVEPCITQLAGCKGFYFSRISYPDCVSFHNLRSEVILSNFCTGS